MRNAIILILIVVATALSAAPSLTIDAPDSLRVGQRFTAEVTLEAADGQSVTPPPLGVLGELELIDIEERRKRDETTFTLTLAPFEPGEPVIPALPFIIDGQTVYTEPAAIIVHSALSPTSTLADIADPAPVHPTVTDIAIPLLALALAGYVLWRLRRKQSEAEEGPAEPVDSRPAWVVALEMLDELRAGGSLERDDMLAWYFGLSMVMRTFLERFTGVNAVEMTTSEIVAALPQTPQRQRVVEFLRKADGVKFAKQQPPSGEASQAADWLEGYLHSFEHTQTKEGENA